MREAVYRHYQKTGTKNPSILVWYRFLILAMRIISWVAAIEFGLIKYHSTLTELTLASILTLYANSCLCACSPLPQAPSKLRQAVDTLKEKWVEFIAGDPIGQPA